MMKALDKWFVLHYQVPPTRAICQVEYVDDGQSFAEVAAEYRHAHPRHKILKIERREVVAAGEWIPQ